MKKPLAVTMIVLLVLTCIPPAMCPGPTQEASAYAPPPPRISTPTSTPPPDQGAPAQETHILPSPNNLPPEVEQARARQVIEAVLTKYLRYWGPRYQVGPVEVTVEGEWAHGVAHWQSQARTLKEPIHILAHRLPDGFWQALMPSTEGLYLQWVDALPESLMPSGKKSKPRIQAAEADALRQPQTTLVVPPAVTPTPSGRGEPSQPIEPIPEPAHPTATPNVEGINKGWKEYSNLHFGYSLEYPSTMFYREWNPAADILHSVSFYSAQGFRAASLSGA